MSLLMKLTVAALWLTAGPTRRSLSSTDYLAQLDPQRSFAAPPPSMHRNGSLSENTVAGYPVIRWVPDECVPGRELVYLHGGGFVHPLVSAHWWIIQRLASAMRAAVTVPGYPLTPEHTVDDAVPVIDRIYDDVANRPGTTELFVAGDSAGGNLAQTLSIRIRDRDGRAPQGVVLVAPWVDVETARPGAVARQRLDPTLRCVGLRAAGERWAGAHPVSNPQISPLFDSGAGLPPTLVFQGGRDIFHDDVLAFTAAARTAGSPVRLEVANDGFHVYLGAYWTPEARAAYRLAARFANDPGAITDSAGSTAYFPARAD